MCIKICTSGGNLLFLEQKYKIISGNTPSPKTDIIPGQGAL